MTKSKKLVKASKPQPSKSNATKKSVKASKAKPSKSEATKKSAKTSKPQISKSDATKKSVKASKPKPLKSDDTKESVKASKPESSKRDETKESVEASKPESSKRDETKELVEASKAEPSKSDDTKLTLSESEQEQAQVIEAALFASPEPLSYQALVKYFPKENAPKLDAIKKMISFTQTAYESRAIRLVEVATGFRFQVAPEFMPQISKNPEHHRPARYSRALLETLALIAYRQPITRGEIEEIRGVAVSTNIVKTLDEQGWIRVVGHKDVPGKPALFATTKYFLDHFGLKTLNELPPLAELVDLNAVSSSAEQTQPVSAIPQADPQTDVEPLAEEGVVSEQPLLAQAVDDESNDVPLTEAELLDEDHVEDVLESEQPLLAQAIDDESQEVPLAEEEMTDATA